MTLATSVICCFNSGDRRGRHREVHGRQRRRDRRQRRDHDLRDDDDWRLHRAARSPSVRGPRACVVVTTGCRCPTTGHAHCGEHAVGVDRRRVAAAWAAVVKATVGSRFIESSWVASLRRRHARLVRGRVRAARESSARPLCPIPCWARRARRSCRSAPPPSTVRPGRPRSQNGGTDRRTPRCRRSSLPRARVTRRYSTEAIDGGSGD